MQKLAVKLCFMKFLRNYETRHFKNYFLKRKRLTLIESSLGLNGFVR
jgi:hypothetical protein